MTPHASNCPCPDPNGEHRPSKPPPEPEWHRDTTVLHDWLHGSVVLTEELVVELRYWLGYFGGDVTTADLELEESGFEVIEPVELEAIPEFPVPEVTVPDENPLNLFHGIISALIITGVLLTIGIVIGRML